MCGYLEAEIFDWLFAGYILGDILLLVVPFFWRMSICRGSCESRFSLVLPFWGGGGSFCVGIVVCLQCGVEMLILDGFWVTGRFSYVLVLFLGTHNSALYVQSNLAQFKRRRFTAYH